MKKEISIEELQIIDDYLRNELKDEKLADFNKELQANPELQAKVKELQLIKLAIGEIDLRKQMDSIQDKKNDTTNEKFEKKKKLAHFKVGLIAASLVLLVGLATYFFINQNENNLYENYYKPDPGLMTVMSVNENYEFQKAMVSYKNGTYDESIKAWQQQLKSHPENDTLIYFLAAAYQANENLDSAKHYLQKIVQNPNSIFYYEAHWYIGLIYLKQSDKKNALKYIEESKYQKSEVLIEKIKN